MYDWVVNQINALIDSGRATWSDVAAKLQDVLRAADDAVQNHASIEGDATAAGYGAEWESIASAFNIKLAAARDLAQAMNYISAGSVAIPGGLNVLPIAGILGSLSIGAALALVGALYVLISQATDFYFKVTGKLPANAPSSLDQTISKILIALVIGAGVYAVAPKLLKGSK